MTETLENIHQFMSIYNVLDDFMSEFFESITLTVQPVIGAVDYFRRAHILHQIQKELGNISNLKAETRDKFLDLLTDIVSVDVSNIDPEDLKKKIENIISVIEEIKEIFEKLESVTNKLTISDRSHIIKQSLIRLNGRVTSIRDYIKPGIFEYPNQLLVLDQILYLIQELIKISMNKHDDKIWVQITVSLLKIEAFHREKISFDDLQDYMYDLSTEILHENLPKNCTIINEYIDKAMVQAVYEKLDNGEFVGRIPCCQGVIAFGYTLQKCKDELLSTLEDWILVGKRLGSPLPVIEGINLNNELICDPMGSV